MTLSVPSSTLLIRPAQPKNPYPVVDKNQQSKSPNHSTSNTILDPQSMMTHPAPPEESLIIKLRHKAEALHLHLHALNRHINEIQRHLRNNEPPPTPNDPSQQAQLIHRLRQGLFQRQQIELDILFAEVEMDVYLWRLWLGGPDGALLPRCAACDGASGVWPLRRDSLRMFSSSTVAAAGNLVPAPLNVRVPRGEPVVRMAPRREISLAEGSRRQRSLMGLVKRLKGARAEPG